MSIVTFEWVHRVVLAARSGPHIHTRVEKELKAFAATLASNDKHQHLLDLLGAKDHEDAARIIAELHARELAAKAVWTGDLNGKHVGLHGSVGAVEALDAFVVAQASEQPFEMRICELRHTVLKRDTPYIFTVDPNCERCRDVAISGHQTDFGSIEAIANILDGNDVGEGVCSEPWQSLRTRLIDLVRRDGAQGEPGEPVAEVRDMKYDSVYFYRTPKGPYLQPGTKLYIAPPAAQAVPAEFAKHVADALAMNGWSCGMDDEFLEDVQSAVGVAGYRITLSGKYDDVLRPFVALMEKELHANAGKGDRPGWLQMDRKTAMLEIYYHVAKLQKAAKDNDRDGIREYAADVANMAMMLVDVYGLLATKRKDDE